jgi:hypothetical protein
VQAKPFSCATAFQARLDFVVASHLLFASSETERGGKAGFVCELGWRSGGRERRCHSSPLSAVDSSSARHWPVRGVHASKLRTFSLQQSPIAHRPFSSAQERAKTHLATRENTGAQHSRSYASPQGLYPCCSSAAGAVYADEGGEGIWAVARARESQQWKRLGGTCERHGLALCALGQRRHKAQLPPLPWHTVLARANAHPGSRSYVLRWSSLGPHSLHLDLDEIRRTGNQRADGARGDARCELLQQGKVCEERRIPCLAPELGRQSRRRPSERGAGQGGGGVRRDVLLLCSSPLRRSLLRTALSEPSGPSLSRFSRLTSPANGNAP